MSKGIGQLQRRIVLAFEGSAKQEIPSRELRRGLGDPDRSNFRRAIRSLLSRGMVEESGSGADARIKLTQRGFFCLFALTYEPGPEPEDEFAKSCREWEQFVRDFKAAKAEERRLRREKADLYPDWLGTGILDYREPGPLQRQVQHVLWYYSDPLDAGLPITVVKAIAGGDRSNLRRAILSLHDRGCLDMTLDETRVRISAELFRYYARMLLPAPLFVAHKPDDELARRVLREWSEELPVVIPGHTSRQNGDFFARPR